MGECLSYLNAAVGSDTPGWSQNEPIGEQYTGKIPKVCGGSACSYCWQATAASTSFPQVVERVG